MSVHGIASASGDLAPDGGEAGGNEPRVRRSTRFGWVAFAALAVAIALLALTPTTQSVSTVNNLTQLLILIVMGTMWNLLAGYAGLVSIGLQAFIGLGGYVLLDLADHNGVQPFVALGLSALLCGAVALMSLSLIHI